VLAASAQAFRNAAEAHERSDACTAEQQRQESATYTGTSGKQHSARAQPAFSEQCLSLLFNLLAFDLGI